MVADAWSHRDEIDDIRPYRRMGALRRFGPSRGVAAVSAGRRHRDSGDVRGAHKPPPAEEPAAPPPSSSANPYTRLCRKHPLHCLTSSTARSSPCCNRWRANSQPRIVTTHGHAVCDFLTQQPNLADAVRYVQT